MWKISQMVCLGILAGMSVTDLLYRKVSGELLAAAGIGAVIFQICYGKCNVWILGGGIAVGLCFLGISRLTGEGIGYGDSIMILLLGIYLGIWKLLILLSGAFFLLALAAVVLLSYYSIRGKGMAQGTVGMKKISRKYALPFYPFLTCGYILYLVSWK